MPITTDGYGEMPSCTYRNGWEEVRTVTGWRLYRALRKTKPATTTWMCGVPYLSRYWVWRVLRVARSKTAGKRTSPDKRRGDASSRQLGSTSSPSSVEYLAHWVVWCYFWPKFCYESTTASSEFRKSRPRQVTEVAMGPQWSLLETQSRQNDKQFCLVTNSARRAAVLTGNYAFIKYCNWVKSSSHTITEPT